MWEIDCYYNERGNEICSYMPNNIEKDMELNNLSINLFLTGIARSGKSTFTNKINDNKLLALESCDKSSVTTKVSEYKIIGERKSDKDGFIKIIDSPGFNYEKDTKKVSLTNIDKINENIKNAIEIIKIEIMGMIYILFYFFSTREQHYKVSKIYYHYFKKKIILFYLLLIDQLMNRILTNMEILVQVILNQQLIF